MRTSIMFAAWIIGSALQTTTSEIWTDDMDQIAMWFMFAFVIADVIDLLKSKGGHQ